MGLDEASGIRRAGSTLRREVLAGLATFATLSYILLVQPAVLSNPACRRDAGGVLFATCAALGDISSPVALLALFGQPTDVGRRSVRSRRPARDLIVELRR